MAKLHCDPKNHDAVIQRCHDAGDIFLVTGEWDVASFTGPGELYLRGTGHGVGCANDSDRRYKKNIRTVDNALAKVQALDGVTYEWDRQRFANKGDAGDVTFATHAEYGDVIVSVGTLDVDSALVEKVHDPTPLGFTDVASVRNGGRPPTQATAT